MSPKVASGWSEASSPDFNIDRIATGAILWQIIKSTLSASRKVEQWSWEGEPGELIGYVRTYQNTQRLKHKQKESLRSSPFRSKNHDGDSGMT
jgi:hypothetical protein